MFDFDLAELYQVETKVMNQAVKRNKEKFPRDFMFRLTGKEWKAILSQVLTGTDQNNWSQIVTSSKKHRGLAYLPYVFTEHGVGMLASVLNSKRAVKMNIAIVRVFITLRQFSLDYKELAEQIGDIREKVANHSDQLDQIYLAIENMLKEKAIKKSWEERERIGFKK
jgi:hypothetical protein